MAKREVKEPSLLGQFYPCIHRDLKEYLEGWRVYLCEPSKSIDIEKWGYLEFNFTGNYKNLIYRDLARAYAYGWFIPDNLSKLAQYMALHSNLATNDNLKTRKETIRQGIKRQLDHFEKEIQYRKEHGNIIIKPLQGHLPAQSNAGASCRVNQ